MNDQEKLAEQLFAIRTLMGNSYFVQGNGQVGIANEALLPHAIESYNRDNPQAPLKMPELALEQFRLVCGFDWVPGGNVPVFTKPEDGPGHYTPA